MAFPTVQELKSPSALAATTPGASLRVAGLFAGIGGIELGLHGAGHRTELLCEIEPAAQEVLRIHFPGIELVPDVCELTDLPKVDLVAAGFPCQDLSQAGRTVGIGGARSGLVGQVFRLLERSDPTWLLLENVPFMLQLDRGHAMRHVTDELGRLGFRWAYRVVDARAFGVPQRRQRVILLASRREDPRWVLFGDDAGERADSDHRGLACGFYWTEGLRGLGWAVDAVPTLKGGSTIGIPSPPAVWMPEGLVGTPHIGDAERLQGFDEGWTASAASGGVRGLGLRWKLVGNAVCVPVARWLGERLAMPRPPADVDVVMLQRADPWPRAAWGEATRAFRVNVSRWPVARPAPHLRDYLHHRLTPLSVRAGDGFLSRAERASLRFPDGLLEAIRLHVQTMRGEKAA